MRRAISAWASAEWRQMVRSPACEASNPVLDVKPWFEEFGPRGEVRQPPWSHEVMADYW